MHATVSKLQKAIGRLSALGSAAAECVSAAQWLPVQLTRARVRCAAVLTWLLRATPSRSPLLPSRQRPKQGTRLSAGAAGPS
jgi:hypothetical protein